MATPQAVNPTVNLPSFMPCKFMKHLTDEQQVFNVNELPSLNTLEMIQSPKGCFTPLRDCYKLPCLHYVDSYTYIIQFPSRWYRGEFIRAYIIYTCLVEGTLIFVREGEWRRKWVLIQSTTFQVKYNFKFKCVALHQNPPSQHPATKIRIPSARK